MTALVLIDIQNDYFPGGKMKLVGSEAAAEAAARLLRTFREAKLPVVHIRHVSTRPGSTFFLPGTAGADIHASVIPLDSEPVFTKHVPNSFRETPLKRHLDGLGALRLVIAGMMTHMCVDTTVRAAFDMGFPCLLAHDACATRALSFGDKTVEAEQVQLAYLAALDKTFAEVGTADDICREIAGK